MDRLNILQLKSLCRQRGWEDPVYIRDEIPTGYWCAVIVNRHEYLPDSSYDSELKAQEMIAMRAWIACSKTSPADPRRMEAKSETDHDQFIEDIPYSRRGGNSYYHSNVSSVPSIINEDSFHSESSVTSWPSAINSLSTTPPSSAYYSNPGVTTEGLYSVREESVKAPSLVQVFENAILALDSDKVYQLLQDSFDEVAVQGFSWLVELRQLGCSPEEIAEELLEKSRDGSLIFSEFKVPIIKPFTKGLHVKGCLHELGRNTPNDSSATQLRFKGFKGQKLPILDETGEEVSVTESIEYFCGIGGVSPVASGARELQFGDILFEDDYKLAIVSLDNLEPSDVLCGVLERLEMAAGLLQQAEGCCDSFTFLRTHGHLVELQRIDLHFIRGLRKHLSTPDSMECIPDTLQLPLGLFPWMNLASTPTTGEPVSLSFLYSLSAQFLSLAFLSYSQAHSGAIQPLFLDTPIERVLLLGNARWGEAYDGPCILASLVELTCVGDMLQQPVFVFQFFQNFSPYLIKTTIFSETIKAFDLFASPEDLLDTWGPGELLASSEDPEDIYAISIGGGTIVRVGGKRNDWTILHWSREPGLSQLPSTMFNRRMKTLIGAEVSINNNCEAEPQKQLQMAFVLLQELGTSPSYWEVAERQLGFGFQGGQSAVAILQFNQTWVKRHGMTKKSKLLAQKSLYMADLESFFGVQVSVCTGIARRVRLRDILADVLPAFVGALVTKPRHWKTLDEEFHIFEALRNGNMREWLESLDHDHQSTFESLVFAVLFLLQDTGVDRKGQDFILGCIQPDLPFQCFRVPCREESYWTRMVADSEEIATFAYITTQCLETNAVKCRGSNAPWANSTGLFWTAVSCCQSEPVGTSSAAPPTPWVLKHSEAYLVGKIDAPLFVQVDRPDDQEEPRLLVSVSSIRPDILRRFYRKGRLRPRRLRERRTFDQIAESVVVLARESG